MKTVNWAPTVILIWLSAVHAISAQETADCQLTIHFGLDFAGKPFEVRFSSDPENRLNHKTIVAGQIGANGTLVAELQPGDGELIVVLTERIYFKLWLEEGLDLVIEKQAMDFQFSGSAAQANRLLFESGLMTPQRSPGPEKIDFAAALDSIDHNLKLGLDKLASMKTEQAISERFELFARAEMIGSAGYDKNVLRLLAKNNSQVIPEEFLEAIDELWNSFPVYEDPAALLSPTYRQALSDKFGYLAEKQLIGEGLKPHESPSIWLSRELLIQRQQMSNSPLSCELLSAKKLNFAIQHFPDNDFLQWKSEYDRIFPGSDYSEILDQRFAASRKIDLESTAMDIEFMDNTGKSVSFSDLSNKIIYLDFWGSWCKPCVASHPALNKLVTHYENQSQVVFVLINLDDSVENWKQFISDNQVRGTHWKAIDEDDESTLRKLFMISGLPRYMLFGPGYKLVSAAAPPPGKPQITDLIDKTIEASKLHDDQSSSHTRDDRKR